ncbi:hypothetical protein C6497_07855 [Candidatus Poribacteria bacterium]|nr:MAG: hypothetical protein C6497_07855 [Candidatus Poribacteria bacterium]
MSKSTPNARMAFGGFRASTIGVNLRKTILVNPDPVGIESHRDGMFIAKVYTRQEVSFGSKTNLPCLGKVLN